MFSKLRCRLSYANVVSTVCLFIVLGGTSYAVATGSIDSREIKNNSIRGKDIRTGTIRSSDVGNRSLLATDFKPGQLPAGPGGPQGVAGPRGPRGPEGPPGIGDSVRVTDVSAIDASDSKQAHAVCPEGTVVLGGGYTFQGLLAERPNITVTDSSDQGAYAFPDGGGWVVRAFESTPVTNSWGIEASAICG